MIEANLPSDEDDNAVVAEQIFNKLFKKNMKGNKAR